MRRGIDRDGRRRRDWRAAEAVMVGATTNVERNAVLTPMARAAAGGDSAARSTLLRLVHGHRLAAPGVRRVIGNDASLEEEAMAGALAEVALSIHGFRGESEFLTWLHTIAGRSAKAALTNARHNRHDALGPANDVVSLARRLSSVVASREAMLVAIEEAFAALPKDQAETLRLREIEQLSYEEIADELGVPIGTIRSRVHRARLRVVESIRDHGLDIDG